VIAEPCIGQKDNSCTEVCPVDCIHPTPTRPAMSRPSSCTSIRMSASTATPALEACPVDAVFAEDQLPAEYAQINANFFKNAP
jgi:ferredoxin